MPRHGRGALAPEPSGAPDQPAGRRRAGAEPAAVAEVSAHSIADASVVVEHLSRTYRGASAEVHALNDVSMVVPRGSLVAVRGRSGAGKTTLLNAIGGLDRPDSGRVVVEGRVVTELDERSLVELRRETVGFVFQSFGLIPILSAAENIGVPLRLTRTKAAARDERVAGLLELVGLSGQAAQRPYELSGGQQQRVAIARALANSPQLIIADEPTGQLDSQTALTVMELLQRLVRHLGVTVLVATHDPVLIGYADDVIELQDGVRVAAEAHTT